MKEIDELDLPGNLRYAKDHEWAELRDGKVRVGISDYAQDQLGDVVFVDLPEVGASFGKGEQFGFVESAKAVGELFMPLGGEIVAVNQAVDDSPELVNQSPYTDGWMVEVQPSDPGELDALMTNEAYRQMLEDLE